MREVVKPEDLKVGDRITVTFDAAVAPGAPHPSGDLVLSVGLGPRPVVTISRQAAIHMRVEREAQSLMAGDMVLADGHFVAGEIRMIDGDEVWVRFDDGTHTTCSLAELRRA